MAKIRLTVTYEYEIHLGSYPEGASPEVCADMNRRNFKDNPNDLELLADDMIDITAEVLC